MAVNCPFMWQSIYSETALSTMTAEIIALVHSCYDLFLIMDGVSIIGKVIGFLLAIPSFKFQFTRITLELLSY